MASLSLIYKFHLIFRCKICGVAFVSDKATAQHMKNVHKVPGPRSKGKSAEKSKKEHNVDVEDFEEPGVVFVQ